MSNLLMIPSTIDIGVNGITLNFSAIDDDLAELIYNAKTFNVTKPIRHAKGTSDVSLQSEKGLAFIERPLVPDDTTGNNKIPCCCTDGPLVEEPTLSSDFRYISLVTEELYNELVDGTMSPTLAELGDVLLEYKEVGTDGEGNPLSQWVMSGTLNEIKGSPDSYFKDDGAYVNLILGISDYAFAHLGILATENPNEPVLMFGAYGVVKNYTAKQLYDSMSHSSKMLVMFINVGVSELSTTTDISLTANWDGSHGHKFTKTTTVIDMSSVTINPII